MSDNAITGGRFSGPYRRAPGVTKIRRWQDADAWLRERADDDERRNPSAFVAFVTDPLGRRHTPNGSRINITRRDYEGRNADG